MRVTAVKTKIVEVGSYDITELLADSLKTVEEKSVVAITSKVVSLCEGSALPLSDYTKAELIEREADLFIPGSENRYGVYLTIKNNMLVPTAGIDESNTNGHYVLWPKDPQASANRCWQFIKNHFGVKHIGIIITDSISSPLRLGVTGRSIAACGFKCLTSRIGHTDLFGKPLRQTRINVADALAASAVLVMGESDEQTPVALLEDMPFVEFTDNVPTKAELDALKVEMEDDLYAHFLDRMDWRKGKG